MNNSKFFFITTYDSFTGALIASLLNEHPDIYCSESYIDPFLLNLTSGYKAEDSVIDNFIARNRKADKRFNGNAQRFSAFELQHKTLTEKCKTPHRRANLAVSPSLRINLLVKSWIDSAKTPELAMINIEHAMRTLRENKDDLFEILIYHAYYHMVTKAAEQEQVDMDNVHNQLFLTALAKVLTYDTADLPTSTRTFRFEALLNDENNLIDFINYLTSNKIHLSPEFRKKISAHQDKAIDIIRNVPRLVQEDWQTRLIEKFVTMRIHTIYYPHVDLPLSHYYKTLGYESPVANKMDPGNHYSKLISIQLNSNRPAQIVTYFDNIEETTDHPELVEVIVNIDNGDHAMESVLRQEMMSRKFTIKFISTPRPQSFCDLWEPINKLLPITDPDSYFLLNISDEMLFATKGWDTILKKYVGFFPDHLFRLRASRNKLRNYFDRWECSFGQDAIPITTKKWVDVGGDWNPCFGPDSFQQLIMFYLSQEGKFSSQHYLRELPLLDIKFHGDVPGLGIDREKAWKHARDHINAMQICQSYPMQLEARRRAMLINAHMIAFEHQLNEFDVEDVKKKKRIRLVDLETQKVVCTLDYSVSWLDITLTNQLRKLHFNYYFGAGKTDQRMILLSFAGYLKAKYHFMNNFYRSLKDWVKLVVRPSRRNMRRKRMTLADENRRLKELFNAACLENESLQGKILATMLTPEPSSNEETKEASNAS